MKWLVRALIFIPVVVYAGHCGIEAYKHGRSHAYARQGAAEHLIDNLTQSAKNYETDHGEYPPGDGRGTRALVEALRTTGSKGLPYFDFPPGTLTNRGDIKNPVNPDSEILYYARKYPGPCPRDAKNRAWFDIWGRGVDSKFDADRRPSRNDRGVITNWD